MATLFAAGFKPALTAAGIPLALKGLPAGIWCCLLLLTDKAVADSHLALRD